MELSSDNYREIVNYLSEKDILNYSLVSKNWLRLLQDRRSKILIYGFQPSLRYHTAYKFGKYYDGMDLPEGDSVVYPCEGVTFYLWGNRFEMKVDIDTKPNANIKEQFDKMFSYLTGLGYRLVVSSDEIHSYIDIHYKLDPNQLNEEILKLGFDKIEYNNEKSCFYIDMRYRKLENGKEVKIRYEKGWNLGNQRILLDCYTEANSNYYMKLMNMIERLKLPRRLNL